MGDEDDEKGERQSRDDKRGITLRDEQNARVELRMYDEAADALHESRRRGLNTSEYLLRSGLSKVLRRGHEREVEKAMQKENEAVMLASSGGGRRCRRV